MLFCDFHIHSKYSRATSANMDLEHLSENAKIKGLGLLGTGDFTHPKWFAELKNKLKPVPGDLFEFGGIKWMLTSEVSTVYPQGGKIRKIHHILHAPSFEIVEQINELLASYGDLSSDGRPTLSISSPELVEKLLELSKEIFIVSAHAWTPWFSVFGSKSGFDSMEECYQDQIKNIYAIETGLSSDPPMNWRLSSLDRFALLSNSDSHSPNIWRIGRECNAFELEKETYFEIWDAIKKKDSKRFKFTIEVDPAYGKYHFDGHRNCNVSLSPAESKKYGEKCPVCRKSLTLGVLHRVEELADRPEGFVPENAIPFKRLLPLYELISATMDINSLYSKKVVEFQNKLLKLGSELDLLLFVSKEKIEEIAGKKIADLVIKNRTGALTVSPGYDGVYGKLLLDKEEKIEKEQKTLNEF